MYYCSDDDRLLVIAENLMKMTLIYKSTEKYSLPIQNGLMSGFKTTNLFGTILNKALIIMAD